MMTGLWLDFFAADNNPLSHAVRPVFNIPHHGTIRSIFHQFVYEDVMGDKLRYEHDPQPWKQEI